jgi:hypothetical protein
MTYYKLDKVFMKETGNQITFGDGELIISDDGFHKSWEVQLASIENGEGLQKAFDNREKPILQFITDESKEFEGSVLISKITSGNLGVYIELVGTGKLKGY